MHEPNPNIISTFTRYPATISKFNVLEQILTAKKKGDPKNEHPWGYININIKPLIINTNIILSSIFDLLKSEIPLKSSLRIEITLSLNEKTDLDPLFECSFMYKKIIEFIIKNNLKKLDFFVRLSLTNNLKILFNNKKKKIGMIQVLEKYHYLWKKTKIVWKGSMNLRYRYNKTN